MRLSCVTNSSSFFEAPLSTSFSTLNVFIVDFLRCGVFDSVGGCFVMTGVCPMVIWMVGNVVGVVGVRSKGVSGGAVITLSSGCSSILISEIFRLSRSFVETLKFADDGRFEPTKFWLDAMREPNRLVRFEYSDARDPWDDLRDDHPSFVSDNIGVPGSIIS